MDIKNIYMVKFSYRDKNGTIDYEFQSSSENYLRLDGEKKHHIRFIGLEHKIYNRFIQELLDLGVLNWEHKVNVYQLDSDAWSLLLCGTNNFIFSESNILEEDYQKLFKIIKKYDLD